MPPSKCIRKAALRLGLPINFGEIHLKNGIERIVNGLPEEGPTDFGSKLLSFFAALASLA